MTIALTELCVGDTPDLWEDLGFASDGPGRFPIGSVVVRATGEGRGITGLTVAGLAPEVSSLDGVVVARTDEAPPQPEPTVHANGVTSIDHVVMATPDLPRTVDVLTAAGLELRRVRDAGRDRSGVPRQQAFFWLGEVILEVVGPAEAAGDGPSTLWGLALTGDLEAAARHLGDRLRPPKDAVQPGRRIATLDRSAGSSVPVVIMSPHPQA